MGVRRPSLVISQLIFLHMSLIPSRTWINTLILAVFSHIKNGSPVNSLYICCESGRAGLGLSTFSWICFNICNEVRSAPLPWSAIKPISTTPFENKALDVDECEDKGVYIRCPTLSYTFFEPSKRVFLLLRYTFSSEALLSASDIWQTHN